MSIDDVRRPSFFIPFLIEKSTGTGQTEFHDKKVVSHAFGCLSMQIDARIEMHNRQDFSLFEYMEKRI